MSKEIWKNLEFKISMILLAVVLSLSVSLYIVKHNEYYNLILGQLREDALTIHKYAEEAVDKRSFSDLNTIQDEHLDIYITVHEQLDEIRRIANIRYLYTAKQNEQGEFIYLVDGLDKEDELFRNVGSPIENEILPMLRQCLNDEIVYGDNIMKMDWGYVYVTYFPFHDSEGNVIGAIGMEFDAENVYFSFVRARNITIIISVFIAGLFILISYLVIRSVIRNSETVFTSMEKSLNEANERAMLMLDTSPICTQIWNKKLETIDCNEAGVKLYGFKDKQEYKDKFLASCSPEYQPDGQRSGDKAVKLVFKAFEEGYCFVNWMHQMPDGTPIPAEVTLVRAKYRNDDVVLGYTRDLREHNKMMKDINDKTVQLEEAVKEAREATVLKNNSLNALENILNSVDAGIYASVPDTGELLFVNTWMKKAFSIEDVDITGKYCYKLFRKDFDRMCSFCPCYQLKYQPDRPIVWEEYMPEIGTSFRNSDSLIDWPDGRKVHLQCSVDITDMMQAQQSLRQRESLLQAVNQSAAILLEADPGGNIESALVPSMEIIGNSVEADRVLIWKSETTDGEIRFKLIHTWLSEIGKQKIDVSIDTMASYKNMPEWIQSFKRNEYIGGPISKLSNDEQDYFSGFDVKSIILIPLLLNEQLWGLVSIDDCKQEREYSVNEIIILKSVSLMMASAINRSQMNAEIKKTQERAVQQLEHEVAQRTQELAVQTTTLTTLLDSIPSLIFTKNADYRFTHCNKALLLHFGKNLEDVIGKTDTEGFNLPPEQAKQHEENNRRIMQERKPFISEGPMPNYEGKVSVFETSIVPLILNDEAVGIAGISHDITQRKEAERKMTTNYEHIKKLSNALSKITKSPAISGGDLKAAADFISQEGCIALGAHRVGIWDYSEGFDALKNISSYELRTGEISISDNFSLRDRQGYLGLLKSERLIVMNNIFECQLISDGYNSNICGALDAPIRVDGKLVGTVCVEQDVCEEFPEKREWMMGEQNFASSLADLMALAISGAQRRNAQEAAETANQAKSSFLANMSHEIRTPMNAIMGITELMIQDETIPAEIEDGLEKIFGSCDLLLGIINDILDFSKIEAGKMDLIAVPYKVASLVNDSINFNILRTEGKNIEFVLQINENVPAKLTGDELRIKQILNNLLSNAFKYTLSGKVTFSVDTILNENDVTLILSVRDTGSGMTKEQLDRVFDEYSRFNNKIGKNIEGTGLGMAITQRLVNLMNGELHAESEIGKGSLFTVKLPQKPVGPEVLGREVAENLRQFRTRTMTHRERRQIIRDPMPYGRVLVVDDVETNLYVAVGLLKLYRLQIDTADSGLEAIEKIKSGKVYDIIFMDHMMPEMDGMETTAHLRDLGYAAPIIALTANAVVGQAEIFLQNGFNEFISKPIDIRQLNSVLNKFVRDKQPEKAIEAQREAAQNEDTIPPVQNKTARLLLEKEVAGIDLKKGLRQYGGDGDTYLRVLRLYTANIRSFLNEIDTFSEETLKNYLIKVHSIKGTSYDIFAGEIGKEAELLENAAKSGDFSYINDHNQTFLEEAWKLVGSLDEMLEKLDAENPKPKKNRPDKNVLAKLVTACKTYDMDGADKIMKEIEMYQYESDDGLVNWLRDNIDRANFRQIAEKLEEN